MARKAHERKTAWPVESVGWHLTEAVPVTEYKQHVGAVQDAVIRGMRHFETANYVYVVDEHRHLMGVCSMRELFAAPKEKAIGDVCRKEHLVAVKAEKEQERAAYLALKHNIKAIPVIDDDRRFLGVIPSDAILHILYKEAHEDLLHLAGIHHRGIHHTMLFDNILQISLWDSFCHRVPWLFLGLFGGIVMANVIGFFESTLKENLILAAFIPLIVYMSSAVGTQTEAFVIRDLALDRKLPFHRYFVRQFMIIAMIAVLFAGVLASFSFVFHDHPGISAVLGVSLFLMVLSSMGTGLLIPYAFSRMRMDPANASGPTGTIIQDLLTVCIYFTVANLLL